MLFCGHGYVHFIGTNHWTILNKCYAEDDKDPWHIQVWKSSTNYGCDNRFWLHFSGGLNMHKEHHLFPGYSHHCYPELRPVLE